MNNRAWLLAALFFAVAGAVLVTRLSLQSEGNEPPAPGPIDVGFTQAMTAHHRQAITMAQLMLDGRPTRLETLARTIAGAQMLELGEMQGWLKLWGKPIHPQPLRMGWMLQGPDEPDEALLQYLLDCEQSPTGMPGLATLAQLEALRASEGQARDVLFLELMLAHHRGGIPMAQFAARYADIEVVRNLAGLIVLDQFREIDRMERMLAAIRAAPARTIKP